MSFVREQKASVVTGKGKMLFLSALPTLSSCVAYRLKVAFRMWPWVKLGDPEAVGSKF